MDHGHELLFNGSQLGNVYSRKLKKLSTRRDVTNTVDLVQAYNKAVDPEERASLLHWLDQYILWFSTQNETRLSPNVIKSYASLAYVQCQASGDVQLMGRFFVSLIARLKESDACAYNIIAALEYALNGMNPSIIKEKIMDLLKIPDLLLARLDPEKYCFTKALYPYHIIVMFALHRTLVVIQTVAKGQLSERILNDIKTTIKRIEKAADYYPYVYNARLIRSSVKTLKTHHVVTPLVPWSRRLFNGLYGSLYMVQGITALIRFELDVAAIENGCKYLREAIGDAAWDKWTPLLQDLMEAAAKSLEDDDFSPFKIQMTAVIDRGKHQRKDKYGKVKDDKRGKMVCFSIISQICMIVMEGSSVDIRRAAMEELMELATLSPLTDDWLKDPQLFEAMLDALYAIHSNGKEHSRNAMHNIERMLSTTTDKKLRRTADSWRCALSSKETAISKNVDDADAEDVLFEAIKNEMNVLSWDEVERNIESLGDYHKSPQFAEVDNTAI